MTERQREYVDAIIKYIHLTKEMPTIRKIAEIVGVSSTDTVHSMVTKLEERGLFNMRAYYNDYIFQQDIKGVKL